MAIQNQSGRKPTKWDKTGVVVKIRPHEQLVVKVDGNRRLTLRNRRFIRELDPRKTRLDDQFAVPERRGAPGVPVTYSRSWGGLAPSLPAHTAVTKDPSMGTAMIVQPTPLSKVQIEDNRGDRQHVVVSIDETRPPADQLSSMMKTSLRSGWMLKFLLMMIDRSERRSSTPGIPARPTTSTLPGCRAGSR